MAAGCGKRRPKQRFRTADPAAFARAVELLVSAWSRAAWVAERGGIPPARISEWRLGPAYRELKVKYVRGLVHATWDLTGLAVAYLQRAGAEPAMKLWARAELDRLEVAQKNILRLLSTALRSPPGFDVQTLRRDRSTEISFDPLPPVDPTTDQWKHIRALRRDPSDSAHLDALVAGSSTTLRLPQAYAQLLCSVSERFSLVSEDGEGTCVVHRA